MDRYAEWLDSILGEDDTQGEQQRYHRLITGQLSRRSQADLVLEILASDVLLAEFSEYWSEVIDSGSLPNLLRRIDASTYLHGLKEISRYRDSGPMALAELAQTASKPPWVRSLVKAYREAMLTGFDDFDVSPDNWLQGELGLACKGHAARLLSWGQLGMAYDMSKSDLPPDVDELATGFCTRVSKNFVETKRSKPEIGPVVRIEGPRFELRAGDVDREFKWTSPMISTHDRLGLNIVLRTADLLEEALLAIESPDVQKVGGEGPEAARPFVGTWLVKGLHGWHGWIPLDAKATLLNMDIRSAFVLTKSPKSHQPESPLDGVEIYVVGDEEERTMSEGSESPFESGM